MLGNLFWLRAEGEIGFNCLRMKDAFQGEGSAVGPCGGGGEHQRHGILGS